MKHVKVWTYEDTPMGEPVTVAARLFLDSGIEVGVKVESMIDWETVRVVLSKEDTDENRRLFQKTFDGWGDEAGESCLVLLADAHEGFAELLRVPGREAL